MRNAKPKGIRTKRGHVVADAPPTTLAHGRPLAIAPASRVASPRGEPAERYLVAQLEREIAKARGDARAMATAKRRSERARSALLATEGGMGEVRAINEAVGAAGKAIGTAARAHASTREYAEQVALAHVQAVREHGLRTSRARGRMLSACAWAELEAMLRDRAMVLGIGGEPPDDKGPTFVECLKLAAPCEASSRNAEGWALHLEAKGREARKAAEGDAVFNRLVRPTLPQDGPDDVEASDDGDDDEDAPTRHQGAAPGADEDGGDTDVSPAEQGDRSMHWRRRKPEPQPEPPVESEHARERREAEHRRQLSMASWGRADGPTTRWDSSHGRMVPIGQPGAAAPPPAPPPARRAPRAPDGPPAPRPPPGAVMAHNEDGTWSLRAPPAGARPSQAAIDEMRAKGVDVSRWERGR